MRRTNGKSPAKNNDDESIEVKIHYLKLLRSCPEGLAKLSVLL